MLIKIENIPKNTTKPEIRELFSSFGRVTAILKRGNSAFVHMPARRRAQAAIDNLDSIRWKGNYIVVKPSERNLSSTVCSTTLGITRML